MSSSTGDADVFAQRLLSHPTATEARAWLRRDDGVSRTLGESDSPEQAIQFVDELYAAGAICVTATEIDAYETEMLEGVARHENTGHLILELPADSRARKQLFRIQGKIARELGFDPTEDIGQRYLYCMLD